MLLTHVQIWQICPVAFSGKMGHSNWAWDNFKCEHKLNRVVATGEWKMKRSPETGFFVHRHFCSPLQTSKGTVQFF